MLAMSRCICTERGDSLAIPLSKVLIFHKGQGTVPHYSYNNEKKSLQGKFLLFEHIRVRLIVNSCIHVLLRGHHKKERFLAIKDALRWSKNRNL